MTLTNARLAALLYKESLAFEDQKARSLRRAARQALVWPDEVVDLLEAGRSLTELNQVGPWVARRIHEWVEAPPDLEDDELRSGFITMSHARKVLAEYPDWQEEVRADLQMHSVYSDGSVSIAEMAGGAAKLGYEYIAMTDHSKGLRIAGGIDEVRLAEQRLEIDDVNAQLDDLDADLTVLRSIELNLSPTGDGDMEPSALTDLDVVVGSFHSKLRVKDDQTERALGAVRNPHVQVIGHPTGRMFGIRRGVRAEWGRVLEAGRERGKAFEINAQPNRQDFSIEYLRLAREAGVMLTIGTDAHSIGELYNVDLSLAAAILADIPKEQILNFRPLEGFLAWVEESRLAATI
ncbi:MAG: PHP domain-containing protein [Actinomycetota bacterium]